MASELVFQLWALEAGATTEDDVAELAGEVLLTEDGERDLAAEAALELNGFGVDGERCVIETPSGYIVAY